MNTNIAMASGPRTRLRTVTDLPLDAVELLELARRRGVVLCTNGHDIGYWPGTGQHLTQELELAIDRHRKEITGLLKAEWRYADRFPKSEGVH